MYGTDMKARRFISLLLTCLVAQAAWGQVLTDGISGKDRIERLQFIEVLSSHGDTLLVETDTVGRFEIDPSWMERLHGTVYLKPLVDRPKPKLTMVNPFDSINVYRCGRSRFLSQDFVFNTNQDEPVIYYDPETILLKESVIRARRGTRFQDKVLGALDSLNILKSPEWVCVHGDVKYINDYRGYSHHPGGTPFFHYNGERLLPKRGEAYKVSLIVWDDYHKKWWDLVCKYAPIVYPGPQYTEDDLLEMYGMKKAQGYHPKREFYEPDAHDLASSTPDYRNLLQWKPTVLTDENGIVEIPFAASDVNTEFFGVVEALDGLGLIGCQTFSFRVIKQ